MGFKVKLCDSKQRLCLRGRESRLVTHFDELGSSFIYVGWAAPAYLLTAQALST